MQKPKGIKGKGLWLYFYHAVQRRLTMGKERIVEKVHIKQFFFVFFNPLGIQTCQSKATAVHLILLRN